MRVLVDTNIVLDFLLQREPFSQDADLLFQAIDSGQVIGCFTVNQGLEAILTRDAKGFLSSSIPMLLIQELFQRLGKEEEVS